MAEHAALAARDPAVAKPTPLGQMKKADCLAELQGSSVVQDLEQSKVSISSLSVPELRELVKQHRIKKKEMRAPVSHVDDFAQTVFTAPLPKLKQMCKERGIAVAQNARVGELRILLRKWNATQKEQSTQEAAAVPSSGSSPSNGSFEMVALAN